MSVASCAFSRTLPLDEIARLEALEGAEINEAKKVLATVCDRAGSWARGGRASRRRRRAARSSKATRPPPCPTHLVEAAAARAAGIPLVPALGGGGAWSASNGEARRLIRGGGARVNDVPVTDEAMVVSAADLRDGAVKLSAGRKQHRLVRAVRRGGSPRRLCIGSKSRPLWSRR